ncbi:MAG TPA: alpha/beta fold hydrolase [Candidatus Eremiobacteraceae bacterium]|nr:alpha/beta fold hydrolase [Candidatus Eremiobacteraceae bacterium]
MIAAIAAAALASAVPTGTYTYEFRQGGSVLGTSIIGVVHDASVLKVHEVVALAGRSFTLDQTLDPSTFVPSVIDALYPGSPPAAIHIIVTSTGATETVAPATSRTIAAPKGAQGFVALDGPIMSGFFLGPAQAQALGAATLEGVSAGAAQALPMTVTSIDKTHRPSTAPASDLGVEMGGLPSGDVDIWYDPTTLVPDEIDVTSQGIAIVLASRTAMPNMAATPAPEPTAFPTPLPHFSSQDVTFRSADGTTLAGTLTVPDGAWHELPEQGIGLTHKTPAVVLVVGSGPVDRDERVGPNPIFLELSNALSNHGYVVLRYDKRGVGKSGGIANAATRDDLLADARAAIAFVTAQPMVDGRRIFVVGHSEGGELAPSLAAGGAPLRGIALMAPPAIPLEQILLQQATLGLSGAAADAARSQEAAQIAAIKSGKDEGPGTIWLRTSFGIDPAVVIRDVPCPILVLQGGKDFQVLVKDLPRLVQAAQAAHRDITVHVFPDDDHLFITVPGDTQATIAEYMVPHHVDPAMIAALLAWLDQQSK